MADDLLMFALETGAIDEVEYPKKKANPVFPYWNHAKFNINAWTEDECWADFRFHKDDLYRLQNALNFVEPIITDNRLNVDPLEALCILLKRLAFPCRYSDMIPRFGRSVPDLCLIFNKALDKVHSDFGHLLTSFDQQWLSRQNLKEFADAIHAKGAPLDVCWGFIDGTLRQVARPGEDQQPMYSGHKRHHGFKMQSISAPNGLIVNLYGPIAGSRHDSYLLSQSGLLNLLERYSYAPNGQPLCVYGDPAYPFSEKLQTGFKNASTPAEDLYNQRMSSVRVSVEWVFGDVIERFKFTDFSKMQKIGLSAVTKQYVVSALLSNARTCIHGSVTSEYFSCKPPSLESYLSG